MLYGKYNFTCRFQSDAFLPPYKGSTFRGLFGKALRGVVCALRRETCADCLLKERCIYAVIFEVQPPSTEGSNLRVATRPHPFVIEPPLDGKTHFAKGSDFSFSLLLFGESNRNIPYFIYAIEQMGTFGLGRKVEGTRGTFILEEVSISNRVIYSNRQRTLKMDESLERLSLPDLEEKPQGVIQIAVSLLTPLRLKFRNRLHAELPFHILVRAMIRRISSLFNAYGNGEPPLDYKGLVRRAEGVAVVASSLSWFDWERYSARQEREMLMGGMTGSVSYEGQLWEYLPLLDLCSKVHIGKQTAFGLGKFQFEVLR